MAGSSAGRRVAAAVKLPFAIVVAGMLVAMLLAPFVGGIGIVARNSVQAFEDQPCDVNPVAPPQGSVMYAANGQALAKFYAQNREIVSLKKIPDIARKAIIAIEDRRFYDHHGVDVQGLTRAVIKNSRSGAVVQGGSTLTQQYVKNLRLYTAKTDAEQKAAVEQTTARKLIEARCALTLEQKLSKDKILEGYLNITNFGAGAYGIQTAAKTYFGIPASKLSLAQAALLAGIVQSPTRYSPYNDVKAATSRRNTVLDEMQNLGYITAKQAAHAKASPMRVLKKRSTVKDCANAVRSVVNVGFFCDYVKMYLEKIGLSKERLETGGYRIYTTLDPQVQNSIQAAMPFDRWVNRRSTAIMDVIEPKTGKVLAFGVSRRYGNNPKDRNVTAIRLNTGAFAGGGSTYKMFTLVSALKAKVPLRDYTIDVKNEYTATICKNYGRDGIEPYTVKNATEGYREGAWNLEDGTVQSVNTFFVALLDQRFNCDLSDSVHTAEQLGLNSIKPIAQRIIRGQQASFTLGPFGTSPLDLASAYGTLAAEGKHCPPTPIAKIVGANNKPFALPERPCEQVLDPAIANTVSNVLKQDTTKGTAAGAFGGGPQPVAGKTGTASATIPPGSDGNAAAWFVGYTPDYVSSVAVFNPDNPNSELNDVPGKEGGVVYGAYSAGIWRDGLSPILAGRQWSFPPEDPSVVAGDSVPVPSVVGQDVATATAILQGAGFQVKVASERKESPLPPDRVAEQSPSQRASPGQTVYLYLSTGTAPKPTTTKPPRPRPGPPGPGG